MKVAIGDHVCMDLIEVVFVSACRMGEDIWKWVLGDWDRWWLGLENLWSDLIVERFDDTRV